MAKKKKKPSPGRGPKKTPKRKPRPPVDITDPRVRERMLREAVAEYLGAEPDDPEAPASRADRLLDEAARTADPKRRAALAHEALQVDPDCVDAYLLLADSAPARKERLGFYEQAVAAGERALGPQMFQQEAGHFWGLVETRPYMRAREALAHALWMSGRQDEAVGHLQEMLRLNPHDNQGVRYTLATWLAVLGKDQDLTELLGRYDEDSAMWAYNKALLAFRREGDTPASRKLLKAARTRNKFVPAYLTGEKMVPSERPPYYGIGDDNEARIYVADAIAAWKGTPGAITWVHDVLKSPRKKKSEPPPAGPSEVGLARLRRLPRRPDDWLVALGQLPTWVEEAGVKSHPWAILNASRSRGLMLGVGIAVAEPTAAQLWDTLAKAMLEPLGGEPPHRPTSIEVRRDPRWDELEPHLKTLGIELVQRDALEEADAMLGHLAEHLSQEEPPGLLDVPGVTPELVGGFYQAAAAFYRQKPWRQAGGEDIIRVECPKFDSGPWYAIVMGEAGLTLGLALYEDLKLLRKLIAGRLSDEQNARQTVALAMTFEAERDIHPGDLEATAQYGWEVAHREAYPSIYRKERGLSMRPPLAWELELMEGCLRAFPEFLEHRKQGQTAPYAITVPVATGTLDLVLSWIE